MESGDILVLKDSFEHINVFVIEKVGSQGFTLALRSNPYQRLTIDKDSLVFKSGPVSVNNLFSIQKASVTNSIEYNNALWTVSAGGSKASPNIPRFLSSCKNGSFTVCQAPSSSSSDISSYFQIKSFPASEGSDDFKQCFNLTNAEPVCPVKQWQLRRFVNEGYMHLSGVIDSHSINNCVRYLNHHLGKPGAVVAGGVQTTESLGKFEGHLSNCAAVRAVFKKSERILDAVLGLGCYDNANVSGQIAFRFSELSNPELTECNRNEIAESIAWHTDGLRQGKSHGFSVLLGVVLSDIEREFSGNLMVWPGSHLLLHRCKTTDQGALDEVKLAELVQQVRYSDLKSASSVRVKHAPQQSSSGAQFGDSTSDVSQHHDNEPELPSLGCPYQITAKAGDVLLLHPDLAHAGGPNYSDDIRKMIYFRIKGRPGGCSWESVVQQHQEDMWVDLPGVRDILGDEELQHIMSGFA